jgi:WD40 repeat protein
LVGLDTGVIEELLPGSQKLWSHEHRDFLNHLLLSDDGSTLASLSVDKMLLLWNPRVREPTARLDPRLQEPKLAMSADGSLLAEQRGDRVVRVWELARAKAAPWEAVPWVNSVALSGDGRVVAFAGAGGSAPARFEVRDLASGALLAEGPFDARFRKRQTVALSHHADRLAIHGSDKVQVYAVGGGAEPKLLCEARGTLPPVSLAPSGAAVVVADGRKIESLRLDGCAQMWTAPLPASAFAFSGDGTTLAVAQESGRVTLLDSSSGRDLRAWDLTGYLFGVALSPDGRHIAAAGESGAWLIDRASGAVQRLDAPSRTLYSVAFSADGSLLVAASPLLVLWEATTGRQVLQFPGDRGTAFAFFEPNGRSVLSFGLAVRREELEDRATTPEPQLAEVLARYKLKLVGQRVVEDDPAAQP